MHAFKLHPSSGNEMTNSQVTGTSLFYFIIYYNKFFLFYLFLKLISMSEKQLKNLPKILKTGPTEYNGANSAVRNL